MEPEEKIGMLCRIHLKAEARINTLLAFIVALPILAVVYGYRLLVWIVVDLTLWVIANIVPIVVTLCECFFAVCVWIGVAILAILAGFVWLLKWCWCFLCYLIRIINWCAVRSIIRMVSLLAGLSSLAIIIYEFLTIPATTRIVTGVFYDTDPAVMTVHIAIVVLMLAIGMYYNAWAYARPEEVSFVCSRTWGYSWVAERVSRWLNK